MATITKPMALDESFNTTESTSRNQADVLVGIEQAIVRGFGQVANAVSYDNTDSGLTADNVQDAIDEVDDTVDGLVDDVTEISSDIESTKTVTGNPITLTDAAPINAESLVVELEPIQEGSGDPSPTNIRPITGYTECEVDGCGDNLLDGNAFADTIAALGGTKNAENKTITFGGRTVSEVVLLNTEWKENTAYTLMFYGYCDNPGSTATDIEVIYTDGTNSYISVRFETANTPSWAVFTTPSDKTIKWIQGIWHDGDIIMYYEKCGVFEGVLTVQDFVPYSSTSATIQFEQTVYGAEVDFLTGVLTVDRVKVDLSTLECSTPSVGTVNATALLTLTDESKTATPSTYTGAICNKYLEGNGYQGNQPTQGIDNPVWSNVFAIPTSDGGKCRVYLADTTLTTAEAFSAALEDTEVCYYLAEPFTIQLTPQELKLLRQYNHITTNGTTITLGYQPDNVIGEVKGEIEKCAVDAEFMQFTDGTDTFTDVNLSLDALSHTVSVVGSKIEQKRFICFEVMDKMGGVLQGILASCIAFTDGAKTPSGTAFRAYIESLQMYVNFRIYGSGGSYTLAYQSETSFSASAFYLRVRMMNNL